MLLYVAIAFLVSFRSSFEFLKFVILARKDGRFVPLSAVGVLKANANVQRPPLHDLDARLYRRVISFPRWLYKATQGIIVCRRIFHVAVNVLVL